MLNIQILMREGHVDDFFGAWEDPYDFEDGFDPRDMNGIVFDIP